MLFPWTYYLYGPLPAALWFNFSKKCLQGNAEEFFSLFNFLPSADIPDLRM